MPGWGQQYQSHQGHELKVNFWSHTQLVNLGAGPRTRICTSPQSFSPSTLCCYPARHPGPCLLLPPSCPANSSRQGFFLPSLPPFQPAGSPCCSVQRDHPPGSLGVVPQETPSPVLRDQGWPLQESGLSLTQAMQTALCRTTVMFCTWGCIHLSPQVPPSSAVPVL